MNDFTFENYLHEFWMENLAEGQTKDASIDATERWMENLDVQELLNYGTLYGKVMELRGMKTIQEIMNKPILI